MENWITIKIFNLPIDASVIRARLESEGIETFLQNELTAQVNPLYSNAIGGIHLQVKESDVEKATEILEDGGYEIDKEIKPPNFIVRIDEAISAIPILKKVPLFYRLIILLAIFFGIFLLIFVVVN